jgi:3-isopropylmalate dehydratase small subunit
MEVRKCPTRTPAVLAANRTNARNSSEVRIANAERQLHARTECGSLQSCSSPVVTGWRAHLASRRRALLDGIYAALADLPVEVDVLVCTPEEVAEWAQNLGPPVGAAERVETMPAFPSELRGRLAFLPQDNLNTDGIYGKDYTYRDDVTREMMAKVVMENYDPQFARLTRPGDVVVGGLNFGTGSSREQAVTALAAKSIPLVVAGSFSQTYLRNAFNNGFLCVEVPELVERLRQLFADRTKTERTIIPGDEVHVDFTIGTIYRGEAFHLPPLGKVPQSLVIAQGVENQVSRRLGLS